MILEARGLKKEYGGRRVVKGVDISIKEGEVVGLLGPNGAGKTTIFYMMVGLAKVGGGEIFLGEERITNLPLHLRSRKGIGYLPQEPSIFRKLSVEENLLAILEMSDIPA
ncbi:MAG: ATP-binding cassette domain-containing protein, partial [Nitrospirota bacterium]